MKPKAFKERRHAILCEAAERWERDLEKVAETSRKLAMGGPMAAASPEQVHRFRVRESMRAPSIIVPEVGRERITGPTIDLDDNAPSEEARLTGRPVARIVELFGNQSIGEGFATGFVVGPGLLMTNWHVFAEPREAIGCGAQFGFELNEQGLVDSGVVFEIDPTIFFLSNKKLDVAVVGLKQTAAIGSNTLASYGRIQLIPTLGKILVGHRISIIQHPDGRHKHWAYRQNKLLQEPTDEDVFLTYTTDTLPGSSGSPAFNHSWEPVAVHHSGVPRIVNGNIMTTKNTVWNESMPESDIDWVGNEGARVSRVCHWLRSCMMDDPSQQALLEALLADSVDPVTISSEIMQPPFKSRTDYSTMNIVVNGTANFYTSPVPSIASTHPVVSIPPAQVGLEARLKFDPDYNGRPGYDSKFLWGKKVPLPTAPVEELVTKDGEAIVLKYHHYSLVMHKKRDLAMWTAANADFSADKRWREREEFGRDTWKADPRIRGFDQLDDPEFYEPAKKFDRGHIVGRASVAWGETTQEEEYGNSDSFHWTNCSPQHEEFNRAIFGFKGVWGKLESHISKQAKFVGNKATILAGPILDENDPKRRFGQGKLVRIPMSFWKIVVVSEKTGGDYKLRAYGFILDQTKDIEDHGWEGRFNPTRFKLQQRSLAQITAASRVGFDDSLHKIDARAGLDTNESSQRPIRGLEDIEL